MRKAERGFTLLEVLAAVALLVIIYTTLARVATEGLWREGESRRRMQASLLADRALSVLEEELNQGSSPNNGVTEQSRPPFTIRREITDYRPPYRRAEEDTPARSDTPLPSLFPGPTSRDESALRKIVIRVVWDEVGEEREVIRTTFGFDSATAAAKLLLLENQAQ